MATIIFENNLVPLKHVLDCLGLPTDRYERIVFDPNYDFSISSQELTDHFYVQELAEFEWKKARRLKQDKGYMGKMALPENINKPARTIMATMSFSARESMILSYVDGRYRAPTIREVACLMSFPIYYRFYGDSVYTKYALVGNAIPPKMAFAFAKAMSEKEGLSCQINHPPSKYLNSDPDFVNLNGAIIPIRKEKTKKDISKFKYHIPYLKIDTYRVELSNHSSDFANKRFQWDVKIHKGQGPKAKVFTPACLESWLPTEIAPKVKIFIAAKIEQISSAKKLQENFCLTDAEREFRKLAGPIELLLDVKSFLNSLQLNQNDCILIQIDDSSVKISKIIAIGYFALSEIVTQINRR